MSCGTAVEVRRLPVAEAAAFLADFRLRAPVVLTGGLDAWPRSLFDWDALAERHGDEPVLSYLLPERGSARMSAVKSDFFLWADGEGAHDHLRRWRFGDFVAALRAGEPHYLMANRTKNTRLRDALAAESGELACPPVAGTRAEVSRREFFIGSAGAGPGLHHDGPTETFLCQLLGNKAVNLFAPSDRENLHPAGAPGEVTGHFSAVADSFAVDIARFPRFASAVAHACELHPGDVLYIPPHWYHDTAPAEAGASMNIRNATDG